MASTLGCYEVRLSEIWLLSMPFSRKLLASFRFPLTYGLPPPVVRWPFVKEAGFVAVTPGVSKVRIHVKIGTRHVTQLHRICLQQWRCGGDAHRLSHLAHFQLKVNPGDLIHLKFKSRMNAGCETLGFHLYLVFTYRQSRQIINTSGVRFSWPRRAAQDVGCGHLCPRDRCTRWIRYGSRDASRDFLCPERLRRQGGNRQNGESHQTSPQKIALFLGHKPSLNT